MTRFVLPLLFGILAAPGEAADSGPRPPVLKPGTWPVDYPRDAVWREQEGRVSVRLAVDEKGKVTGCLVTVSSGFPLLDEATCRTARRARFEPALDASGSPTTGIYEDVYVYALN